MLDGPKPRFPSSVAIATPEDGRRAVRDLKARGVDFIKLQSLIPRDAVFAIADEAKKTGIPSRPRPRRVRAREMSDAGQKSFEHLIGIFEGSSAREDDFLKGVKSPGRFLAAFDEARARGPRRAAGQEPHLAVPDPRLGARREPDRGARP